MLGRLVLVTSLAAGLAFAGSPTVGLAAPAPDSAAGISSVAADAAAAISTRRKPRAPIQATYVLRSDGKVVLSLTTPVKQVTVQYRIRHKQRTKDVAVKSGKRTVVLPAGSKAIKVRAEATKRYRSSKWVVATLQAPPDRWAAIDALLASAVPPPLTPVPVSVTRSQLTPLNGYARVQTCYDGVTNPSQLPVVTPNVSSLWPGALVRGDSVVSGTLDEIPIADRLPMGIGIDNILAGQTASVTVQRPSFTAMHDAMNQIAPAAYHASKQYTVEVEAASTFESLKAKLGVNASGMNW